MDKVLFIMLFAVAEYWLYCILVETYRNINKNINKS